MEAMMLLDMYTLKLQQKHWKMHSQRKTLIQCFLLIGETPNFLVEERKNPRQVRPSGRFAVGFDELWCDGEKFQKPHLPCSHVHAA